VKTSPGRGRLRKARAVGLVGAAIAVCGIVLSAAYARPTSHAAAVLWSSQPADAGDGGAWPGSPLVLPADNKNPTIPNVTVRFAQGPYNDHSYASIGLKDGWFKDVGIDIQPKPEGKIYVDVTQEGPALLANQLDVGTMASSVWLAAMDQSTAYKQFTYVDIFYGHAFLGNPKGHYHPLSYYIKKGLSWKAAVTQALNQIKGKTYAYPAETSQRPFQNYVLGEAGMSLSSFKSLVVDDPKIVELATAGKVDVASPTAGPLVTELLQQGWTPIVAISDVLKYGPASGVESSILSSGWAASDNWLGANHATALRIASVAYRIIDYKHAHLLQAAQTQIPFLNSIAGTHFAPSAAKYLDTQVDPFFSFDQQKQFFVDKSSPYYWTKPAQAAIDSSVKAGTLKAGHNPSQVILAATTWRELNSLKSLTEKLVKEVQGALPSRGTAQAKSYLAKAQTLYSARDYYDSAAFANAAKLWLK
jgi:hypothetical protein